MNKIFVTFKKGESVFLSMLQYTHNTKLMIIFFLYPGPKVDGISNFMHCHRMPTNKIAPEVYFGQTM